MVLKSIQNETLRSILRYLCTKSLEIRIPPKYQPTVISLLVFYSEFERLKPKSKFKQELIDKLKMKLKKQEQPRYKP